MPVTTLAGSKPVRRRSIPWSRMTQRTLGVAWWTVIGTSPSTCLQTAGSYLSRFQHSLPGWEADSKAAALLAGALENDH